MSELIDCINNLSAKDIIKSIAKTDNGTPFYLQTSGLGGFCAEYQTVYDSFATPPSEAIAVAQNTMVCGLVSDGVWAKLDLFYLFAQTVNTASEALVNWVNPGTYDAVLNNAPTFVALEGFTTALTGTKYIKTNWNPTDDGINYTQNSASAGIYIRTNVAENGIDFGLFENHGLYIRTRAAADGYTARVNSVASNNGTSTDSRGFWIITRENSASENVYRNKVVDNLVTASTGLGAYDFMVGGENSGGTPGNYCNKQYSVFFTGGALTSAEVTIMTDAVEVYMDSNSKGVIA